MKKRLFLALFGWSLCHGANAILNGGTHAADHLGPAITAVGGTPNTTTFTDRMSDTDPLNVVVESSNTVGTPFFSYPSGTATNHAVYQVINSSMAGYYIGEDQGNYAILQPQGTIYSRPFAQAGQAPGTPPPIVEAASSSPNSSNGGTGNGIEFGLSASYLGLDTTADSWVSAYMAGFLAQLNVNHPTWTWGDIKGALRQTAANWAGGYDPTSYGYGAINFASANAIASTSAIYLQPPQLVAGILNSQVHITLYPFRTTRRDHEVVYTYTSAPVFPGGKNEYTTADLNAINTTYGGTLVFTSNGTDVIPSGIASGDHVNDPGTHLLVAYTTDGAGNYSRGEQAYSVVTTPAVSCL